MGSQIWTMGELLVEIMRPQPDLPFDQTATFLGPFPSGAPAIFIDAAARVGIKGGIIGGIGNDGFGKNLYRRLENDGVDCRYIQTLPGSTGVAFITYSSDGSRDYIFHLTKTPAVLATSPEHLEVGQLGYFHLMGCSLFMDPDFTTEILKTMETFKRKGFGISFDPNIRTELLQGNAMDHVVAPVLESCSVLLPGKGELLQLSGKQSIEEAAQHLFGTYAELSIIGVKLGSSGCRILTRDSDVSLKAPAVDEVDPTGAGDCFDAGFLSALLKGESIRDAAILGSALGALNVQAFGPMEGKITEETVTSMIQKISKMN